MRDQTSIVDLIISSLAEYRRREHFHPRLPAARTAGGLWRSAPHLSYRAIEIDPDQDVAVLQYTGGTTGVPKAAMLTHYNIFANVIQTQTWSHTDLRRGEDTYLLVIPFHIYGFTVGMMDGLWRGAYRF